MFRRRSDGNGASAQEGPAAPSPHLIDLRVVVKDYVTDAGPFRALDGVDLRVPLGIPRRVGDAEDHGRHDRAVAQGPAIANPRERDDERTAERDGAHTPAIAKQLA